MSELDDHDRMEYELRSTEADANELFELARLDSLKQVARQALRDVAEGTEWLSTARELGETGAVRLATISLSAARGRLQYLKHLRDTFGAGVMFTK